jgi:hypothetical protein
MFYYLVVGGLTVVVDIGLLAMLLTSTADRMVMVNSSLTPFRATKTLPGSPRLSQPPGRRHERANLCGRVTPETLYPNYPQCFFRLLRLQLVVLLLQQREYRRHIVN